MIPLYGIAAGRALAELAAALAQRGQTLFGRLHELYAQYGLWASAARNLAFKAGTPVAPLLDALAAQSNLQLGARRVVRCIDYRSGEAGRPRWLGAAAMLELRLDDESRLFVRPSGTEPKLKLYGHVKRKITLESDFARSLAEARQSAVALLQELATLLQR